MSLASSTPLEENRYMKRLAILAVSLFVAVGTLLAVGPTPAAHAAQCYPGARDAHHRQVNVCGSEPRSNHFNFRGRVLPKYRHKAVLLQRKSCKHCRWHVVRRDRTTARGKYAFRNITKLGYYRVKAKGGGGFRPSYSTTLQIYRV
jgi:hypothetical protein